MKCPKCDSEDIRIKSGIMCDLFICENCNFETRNYNEVR